MSEFVAYSDPRVEDDVRSINRQHAEAVVAAHKAESEEDWASAVEHYFLANQLSDRVVDACLVDDDDTGDDAYTTFSVDTCAPVPPSELDVMETLVGLFADLNHGAKIRVLDWARSRFVG